MNKKIISLVTAGIMVFSTVLTGCGTKSASSIDGSAFTVGLSTDEGGINDKSFNQSANTGLKKAEKDFKIKYKKPIESKQKEDYESNFNALVIAKANLIVGVGYQMTDAVKNVAEKNPETKFVLVDSVVELPNVESILFRDNEGSFLTGVVAGKMTKSNKIGFIGGKESDVISRFENGYGAGVKSVNKDAKVEIRYADSFTETNKGYELAKELIGKGCDVIYHAAGGVGVGMFKAIKEANESGNKVWAIGVDMDQAVTVVDAKKKPLYADIILTSMIKRVDSGTYRACQDLVEGKFKGDVITLGLKEDGVGLAPTTKKNTPKEVIELADKYAQAIKDEKFKVPATREELKDFKPYEIK